MNLQIGSRVDENKLVAKSSASEREKKSKRKREIISRVDGFEAMIMKQNVRCGK